MLAAMPAGPCCGAHCDAAARLFDAAAAARERARYRKRGPDARTRRLIGAIRALGLTNPTILDVGSGLGIVSLELLEAGAATATLADASTAYLDAARVLAAEAALADRMRFVAGDFVETAPRIDPADVVVLDRVVCCYPAYERLLAAAASHCRRALAITAPRHRLDIRLVLGLENTRRRLSGNAFRSFVHRPEAMDAVLRQSGLRRHRHSATFIWNVDLYVWGGES
jgi:magnesium-protoporphyrin O-methyltransferase